MWFKRRQKNRRFERAHVLDVKLRSSLVRANRMRLAGVAFGVLFGTAFGLYLLWRVGDWTLNKLVYQNKSFAIEKIIVQTDGVIPTDQLRRWSGVSLRQNLLALDLARVKRNLELEAMVQSVSVERVLPRTLNIRVTEREPIAQVSLLRSGANGLESAVFQLDRDGYVMLPLDPRQRIVPLDQVNDSLPAISGFNPADIQLGKRVESYQIRAALELIDKLEYSPMREQADLKRVIISSPEVLTAVTGQGSRVTFGIRDLDLQLRRWQSIRERALKANKAIDTLDLSVSENIPVRFLEASAVPPANPRNVKPPRIKKKNV